jgi:hypothetical protein
MRPTDAQVLGILTEAEREEIRASLPDCIQRDDLEVKFAIRRIAEQVWDFTYSSFGGQADEPLWLGTLLEPLSDQCFLFPAAPASGSRTTHEDIVTSFERQDAEALKEVTAWWEDDPEDYRRCKGGDFDGKHPWGDAVIRCRAFIAKATPYRVWKVAQAVREAGRSALDVGLLCYAAGLGTGQSTAAACQRAFSEQVKLLVKELDEAV